MADRMNDLPNGSDPVSGEEGCSLPQRLNVNVKDLRCAAYRGFASVEDGGFIIVKPLGEDGLLCAIIDPAGRGPGAVEIGARLKEAAHGLLGTDFLRYARLKPAAALDRLDEVLDTAMSERGAPGAMAMMGAIIINASTGRASLWCRGVAGLAGVRGSGSPLWAKGGELPPYGTMPREILFMRGKPAPKSYNVSPGDSFILTNPHFAELPGPEDLGEKEVLPVMAARVARGGRLELGGLTIVVPNPEPQTLALPECMALANHALRLAALAADAGIKRGELILEPAQASYFEAVCRASGLRLPEPQHNGDGRVHYADTAPLAVKGLLAISISRRAV